MAAGSFCRTLSLANVLSHILLKPQNCTGKTVLSLNRACSPPGIRARELQEERYSEGAAAVHKVNKSVLVPRCALSATFLPPAYVRLLQSDSEVFPFIGRTKNSLHL